MINNTNTTSRVDMNQIATRIMWYLQLNLIIDITNLTQRAADEEAAISLISNIIAVMCAIMLEIMEIILDMCMKRHEKGRAVFQSGKADLVDIV